MINLILQCILIIVTLGLISARDLWTNSILMNILSLIIAVLYLILGAADVGITEAAVGAGISTILMFATVALIQPDANLQREISILPVLVAILAIVLLSCIVVHLPPFGNALNAVNLHVMPYYIENTKAYMGFPNVVTSILASFRGYDTLGETTVVFVAGLAITLIMGGENEE